MKEEKYSNGVTYHLLKVKYKNDTVEELIVADELGEDCNVYNEKDNILANNLEIIKSIRISHLRDLPNKEDADE